MEIAIPLIALGGMYVVSNQSNENCSKKEIRQSQREKFTNMGIRSNLGVRTDNYLPNTNIPPQNFPVFFEAFSFPCCRIFLLVLTARQGAPLS